MSKQLAVIFVPNRDSEIEPCGCSAKPLGGVDREWNLLQTWKREPAKDSFLTLTAGTTFVPIPSQFSLRNKPLYINKAGYMLEALKDLGVQALSPSIADFGLGVDTLRGLAQRAAFPFISTNLYYKKTRAPIFPRYLELNYGGTPILVLGLSSVHAYSYPPIEEVNVVPPVEALASVFQELPRKPRFIILLSSLYESERLEVEKNFPDLNLILGGAESQTTEEAVQTRPGSIYLNPSSSGKAVARIRLDFSHGLGPLFNSKVTNGVESSREEWMNELAGIELRLRSKKLKPAERKVLEAKRDRVNGLMEKSDTLSAQRAANAINYETDVVYLDATFATPANQISHVLERYKASVHDQALNEAN